MFPSLADRNARSTRTDPVRGWPSVGRKPKNLTWLWDVAATAHGLKHGRSRSQRTQELARQTYLREVPVALLGGSYCEQTGGQMAKLPMMAMDRAG